MRILQNITIKYKLILIIMLTCITGMVLAGATLIARGWSTFHNDMVRSLSTQAEMIAENCKASLAFQDAQDAKKTLQALHVEPTIVFGGVYLKDSKLFAAYYRDYADIKVHPPKFQEDEFVFGEGLLTVFRPIVLEGEVIGTVCLRSDLSPMYATLKHNIGIIIVVLFLSSSVAFFVSSRLQSVISKPILSLAEVAKAVSEEKDYSARAIKQSNDEVGSLIGAFNEMLEQIQQRDVELVDAKGKLEVRVKERTAELTSANEQLTEEIVERKKAEHELKESEKRFQEIVGNACEWVWEVDANGLYTYSSPVIEGLLGYKPEEVVGKKYFYDLFVAEDRDEAKRLALEKFAEKKAFKGFLNANVHKNGQIVWLMTGGVPTLDDDGNLVGYRGSDVDITQQKQAEEIMKRLNRDLESTIAKLGRANNELKDFVYIASHDLREPMRKISAFGELLSTSLKDKLNDDEKENFGFMIDGAKRMQQMIDALLVYSRVSTRGVDFEAVDLNKVMKELCEVELAVKIEETCAKITVSEQLHTVNGDPAQVRQLMQNFIANGLKYQKKGTIPQITIRSSAADNDMVRVEVTDNGIGIKQEYFKNLFIMFRRLHSRQEYEGSGIGLAVCKKIVERHGGDIGVSSTYGEGSTFWFTMPASKPSEEKQAQLVSSYEAGVGEQQDG